MNTHVRLTPFRGLVALSIVSLALTTTALAGPTFNGSNGDFTYSDGTGTAIANYPGGAAGVPVTFGGELYSTGGDATVTYLGLGGASYTEYLFIETPGGLQTVGSALIDNQTTPAGYTVDLGSFAAGEEVEFGIYVSNTGNTWYDGPGTRNSDGVVHAYTVDDFNYTITDSTNSSYIGDTGSGTYVGFEDEAYPGGDFNYSDLQFVFTGLEGVGEPGEPSVPDGGSAALLLGLGLAAMSACRRRLARQGPA